jgi:hypothetical protein
MSADTPENSPEHASPAPQVLTARLAHDAVLLDMVRKQYFQLNESAAVAWDQLQSGATIEQATAALTAVFEVTEADARASVVALLAELVMHGLLAPE